MLRARLAAALVLPVVLLVGAPADAAVGDLGNDVSYPQCSGALPTGGHFGIVGVNNGLPYSSNPCLATEGTWAVGTGQPGLYVNTANPGHASVHWPAAGTGSCVDATVDTDAGCAYGYGRAAAADAFARATTDLAGSGLDPKAVTWWLDVEGANSWVGSGTVNAADLQGFVDGLRAAGAPEVGAYSTSSQWTTITGGYTRANSASYRAAWKLPAAFPIEDGPVWFAGVGTQGEAISRCATTSFTGGERLLAQYADGSFDGDYRCAERDLVAPTVAMTSPVGYVTRTATTTVGWTAADTGGSGLASYDVRYERAPYNGTFQPWALPASWQRTAARSVSQASPSQGWTTCYESRSRDAAGNVSSWTVPRCTAVPLDDRALTASSGWTRSTGGGFFASTYSSSTTIGARLSRTGVQTSRLNLVAIRCATCGKVGVYVGSTLLSTVDLHATTTSLVVIALPRFSLRTATVTLRVLTAGKLVRIDGLATSRA